MLSTHFVLNENFSEPVYKVLTSCKLQVVNYIGAEFAQQIISQYNPIEKRTPAWFKLREFL